jgi:hypothetical protein
LVLFERVAYQTQEATDNPQYVYIVNTNSMCTPFNLSSVIRVLIRMTILHTGGTKVA